MNIQMIAFTEKGYRLAEQLRERWITASDAWCSANEVDQDVSRTAAGVQQAAWPANASQPPRIELHAKTEALPAISDPRSLHEIVAEWFTKPAADRPCDAIIFVGATGIAVRAIAPFISGKSVDPAVLVIDEAGRYVISLLSGHLGGANALARTAASLIGAEPVITTATDAEGAFAVDTFAKENGFLLTDLRKAKEVSAKVLRGEKLRIYADIPMERLVQRPARHEAEIVPAQEIGRADIIISYRTHMLNPALPACNTDEIASDHPADAMQLSFSEHRNPKLSATSADAVQVDHPADQDSEASFDDAASIPIVLSEHPSTMQSQAIGLRLIAKRIHVGLGARKGVTQAEVAAAVASCLEDAGIDPRAVVALDSIDLKKQEAGILAYSYESGVPFVTYTAEELRTVEGAFASSRFVQSVTGVANVCERAAAFAAGRNGHAEVLVHKTIHGNVTTAVAVEV